MSNNLNTNIIIKLKDLFSAPLNKIATNFSKLGKNKGFEKVGKKAEKADKSVKKLNKSLDKNKDLMGALQDIAQVWAGAKFLKVPLSAVTGREEVEFGLGTLSKNLEQFKTLAKEISNSGLYGYNDTMEEFYALISGGLSEEQAKQASKQIQLFAKATRSSLGTATKTIVGAINVSGVSAEKASDVFTKVQYKYQLSNLEQLAAGYSKVGGIAKSSAKLDFTSLNVALGLLNSNMVEAEVAGTAMNAVLRNLPKVAQSGIQVVRDKKGNLDLVATLRNIKKAIDSIQGQENKNAALQYLFGDEGMRGITPLLDNIDNLKEGIDEVNDSTGIASREGAKWQKSLSANLLKLQTAFGNLGQSLGKTVVPALIKTIDGLVKILNISSSLIHKFPMLGQALYNLGIAFLAVKSFNLAKTFLNIAGAVNVLKLGIRGLVSSTGLGLLISIGLTIYEQWDNIIKLFKKIIDFVKNSKFGQWVTKNISIVDIKPNNPNKEKGGNTSLFNSPNIIIHNNGNKDISSEVIRAQDKSFQQLKLATYHGK